MNKGLLIEGMHNAIKQIDHHLLKGGRDTHRDALVKIKRELQRRTRYLESERDFLHFKLYPYGRHIVDSWEQDWKLGDELLNVEQKMQKYLARRKPFKSSL